MEFGSVVFLLRFLPLFLTGYYLVPGRMKNIILLLGSLCFYAWGTPLYVVLMLLVLTSDYCHGLLIEKYQGKRAAGILTGNAIFFDCVILVAFGYMDFGIDLLNSLGGFQLEKVGFPTPIGLTVFMLQTISYVLEVYRGNVKAQRNYLDYAVYVTMFPQMLGGPIVRYGKMESLLHERKVDLGQVSRGMKRFCIGLAKKVILADGTAQIWQLIEGYQPTELSMGTAWFGILAFGFQLYYSFSGYADMAIGLADCLGFEYPENFKAPLSATSVTDFMHKWNITLVKWMRVYFYESLAGKSGGILRQVFAMLFTWALIGLWYGPDGTFLLWGLWMAFFYILEKLFWKRVQAFLPKAVNWFFAMLVICFGWVLFALNGFESVWAYGLSMVGFGDGGFWDRQFFYMMIEYFPLMFLGVLFALPQISKMIQLLRESKNILCITVYRFGEKVVPAILLLLALLKIAG